MTTNPVVLVGGPSTYVDSADPVADHSNAAVVPMSGTTALLYRPGFGEVEDDATAGSWPLTLTAADDFDGSPAFAVAALAGPWQPSVGYADLPATVGSPIAFSGALSAGDQITVDVSALAAAVAGGRADYGFKITRTDGGSLGSFFLSGVGGDRAPLLVGEWIFQPDPPTGQVPCSGGVVGEPRPVLSWGQPVGTLQTVQVQIGTTAVGWTEASGLATPTFTSDEMDSDLPQFDLKTVDPGDFPNLTATTIVWAARHETDSGWSMWSQPQTFGGYVAKLAVTVTSPSFGIVEDVDPLYAWTVTGGTQKSYQIVTYPQGNRATLTDDSGAVPSATTSYQTVEKEEFGTLLKGTDSGAVLRDSSLMTVEFRITDDVSNRQPTIGCPVYTLVAQDFRFSDNGTVPVPDDVRAVQVGASQFVDLYATVNAVPDYIVWMLNGVHIARRPAKAMDYELIEGSYRYHYRYFGAQPNLAQGYKWAAKQVVGGQTSQQSELFLMDSLTVEALWAGDGDPQSTTYGVVAYCSGVGSTFSRDDQAWFALSMGAQFPEFQWNSKGPLMGDIQGTILDSYGQTASFWEAQWHKLCGNGNTVQLAYNNIAYPAVVYNFVTQELEGSGSNWLKQCKLNSVQLDRATFSDEPSGTEGGLVDADFETDKDGTPYSDGDLILRETSDGGMLGVTDIDGAPSVSAAAALHGLLGGDFGWRD